MRNMTHPASLSGRRPARTVLLRMAADAARAQRIRDLKDSRPDLTWLKIGEYCGVTERSAAQWGATGGISEKSARKFAELFGVSFEEVWLGEPHEASAEKDGSVSPFKRSDELADISAKLDALTESVAKALGLLEAQELRRLADKLEDKKQSAEAEQPARDRRKAPPA